MKTLLYVFYIIIQCTWGFLQTAAGFIFFLCNLKRPHFFYRGAVVTLTDRGFSVSLGLFVFVSDSRLKDGRKSLMEDEISRRILIHEYGHTIQSLLLGPLYLIVIGIPSFLWANLPQARRYRFMRNIPYSRLYTERNANYFGHKVTGEKTIDW